MADYIDNVLKASGGYAAPAEPLNLPEEYSEEFVEFTEEDLATLAELQELDDSESFDDYDPILSDGVLVPEEQDLAEALLEVVEKYGKFNDDNTGVWAGYDSAEKNVENAAIGVKCGNCIFWEAPNGCKLIVAETEEGGLCRFAILPDGAVTADADYGDACPPATQDIQLNLTNRQNAIDNVGYGPLNPAQPNDTFWQDKADRWKTTVREAKSAVCGNCIFFDRRPQTLDCIETGIADGGSGDQSAWDAIDQAELGYCTALDFKCAASRTCNAWAAGGPITEDSVTATAGSKPAPKKDQIKGSSKNKKGSAGSGKGVTFSKKIEESLSKKAREHNEKAKDGRKTSLRTLKAVYRRGAGAFSTSHRPDQNRNSWAMARVNAFLKLLRSGKPSNPKYTTDNDLLPAGHPRSSKTASGVITASVESETTMIMSNDPCWDGYKQVGMKDKSGNRVPNCVPAASTLDYVVASANEEFGVARQLAPETAYEVARKACSKYEYISDEELYSAVLWDVMSFVEYATTGMTEDEEEMAEYAGLLPEGHPATESSLVASLLWVASAPELDNSGRQALIRAFSNESDYVDSLHASTRLKVLISSGSLSEATTTQLKAAVQRYQQVD
jgi:hypothetical protein